MAKNDKQNELRQKERVEACNELHDMLRNKITKPEQIAHAAELAGQIYNFQTGFNAAAISQSKLNSTDVLNLNIVVEKNKMAFLNYNIQVKHISALYASMEAKEETKNKFNDFSSDITHIQKLTAINRQQREHISKLTNQIPQLMNELQKHGMMHEISKLETMQQGLHDRFIKPLADKRQQEGKFLVKRDKMTNLKTAKESLTLSYDSASDSASTDTESLSNNESRSSTPRGKNR